VDINEWEALSSPVVLRRFTSLLLCPLQMLDVDWVAGGGTPRDQGGPAGRIGDAVVDRWCEIRGMLVVCSGPCS
jgi:hypothetical protein